jgi:rhodanese-related sulfurtransferase
MSVANTAVPNNSTADLPQQNYSPTINEILRRARESAAADNIGYAGRIEPGDAWTLVRTGVAVLVDVRTAEERKFVGHVPNTLHVAWATGTAMTRNPRFARELEAKVKKDQIVLFLCRSGKRSADAAQAATKAGFTQAFNILEGFEGDIDAQQQRGHLGGWRLHSLPWVQD